MEQMLNFLNKLEAKDIATIIISSMALVISLVSYIQKGKETKYTLRKNLTDILEKLAERNLQTEMHYLQKDKSLILPDYRSYINDQRQFFLWEASSIEKKIKDLVNPLEYLLIAGGYYNIGSLENAEEYYKIAIKKANGFVKGTTMRSYGRFLMNQGRHDEGREHYQEAVKYYAGENDTCRQARGETYQRWACLEEAFGNNKAFLDLMTKASNEYYTIEKLPWRKESFNRAQDLVIKHRERLSQSIPSAIASAMS